MSLKKLFVICGPSGAGLKEIVGETLSRRGDFGAVTPVTARKMKEGEKDGVGFFFYDLEGWEALKNEGDLLECTEFAGNDYGTSRRQVEACLASGKNALLNLEIERAAQLKANMPEAVCVYMEPADPAVLRGRYAKSARSEFELDVRMREAERLRALSGFCDCRIATDDPAAAADALGALVDRLTLAED